MRSLVKAFVILMIALAVLQALTGCAPATAPEDVDTAPLVQPYLDAVATGDVAAAVAANPWSPRFGSVTAAGRPLMDDVAAAVSAAGGRLTVVAVGEFQPVASAEEGSAAPEATTPAAAGDSWWLTDWSGDDWGGSGQPTDRLFGDEATPLSEGVVPVTVALGDAERTYPLGVAVQVDAETGEPVLEYRPVVLDATLAAQYGVPTAPPALPPVAIVLTTGDETPADWWTLNAHTTAERPATVAGVQVEFTDGRPLVLLPGSYQVEVDDDPWPSELFEPAPTPAPQTIALLPGNVHQVDVAPGSLTDAGRELIVGTLDSHIWLLSDRLAKFEAGYELDRCADPLALYPEIHSGNARVVGEGTGWSPAEMRWCLGGGEVVAGQVQINPDGSFTTVEPWRVGAGPVAIEWSPSGRLDHGGSVTVTKADEADATGEGGTETTTTAAGSDPEDTTESEDFDPAPGGINPDDPDADDDDPASGEE